MGRGIALLDRRLHSESGLHSANRAPCWNLLQVVQALPHSQDTVGRASRPDLPSAVPSQIIQQNLGVVQRFVFGRIEQRDARALVD